LRIAAPFRSLPDAQVELADGLVTPQGIAGSRQHSAPVLQHVTEIGEIERQEGISVLLVEQNAHMALDVAHRAYVLQNGTVVMSGTGREVAEDEGVRRAYLGE